MITIIHAKKLEVIYVPELGYVFESISSTKYLDESLRKTLIKILSTNQRKTKAFL